MNKVWTILEKEIQRKPEKNEDYHFSELIQYLVVLSVQISALK